MLTARTSDEVFHCLEKIENGNLWAAGFVSYEAANAFDRALKTHFSGPLPLLCFGLFNAPECVKDTTFRKQERLYPYQLGEWKPSVTRNEYVNAITSIKRHIAAGDTYQVNYTFRLNADFSGDPFSFFYDLATAQQGVCSAFIETNEFAICSASPELFFDLKNGTIRSKPMKGTRARGLTAKADRVVAAELQHSEKDRAENIMIVDMIRNDIGRVAEAGSVQTRHRFNIEKYPTVWQLTSTVVGKTNATFSNILKNLFPCASITGAPKAKTMEIIRRLESVPRGVYTGAIGFIAPNGVAQFNVAIRTAVIDKTYGRAEYGIGGGIVWDSDADAEYDEALAKSHILRERTVKSQFRCLETMLYEPKHGILLLNRHLKRLAESADYFDFPFDETIRMKLESLSFDQSKKIRLLLNKEGSFDLQWVDLPAVRDEVRLMLAKKPVDSDNVFLYHKTTNRTVYETAKADFPEADDVLLFNEYAELTESCIANVVVELDGRRVTPPVSCGLLAGVFRAELLKNGEIEERIISLDDLRRANAIWLINSVRKWESATLKNERKPQTEQTSSL